MSAADETWHGIAERLLAQEARVMREWVVIGPEREFEWDAPADEALAYARRASATSRP